MTDQNQTSNGSMPRPQQVATRPSQPRNVQRSEEMLAWVGHYDNTVAQNQELKTTITRLSSMVKSLEARSSTVTDELRRVTRERNEYQQAYQDLRAAMAEMATISVEALETKR